MKLIDKDALVAKIERRRNKHFNSGGSPSSEYCHEDNEILGIIDTLEVKEVDLEKELIEWHKEHFKKDGTFIGMSGFYLTNNSQMDIAKHFFELGISVSNKARNENSMKKLILLALTAVMMAGCTGCEGHDNAEHLSRQGIYSYISVVIDSCEYVMNSGVSRMSHKGNCKFCAERRKKELEELIMKIKEE